MHWIYYFYIFFFKSVARMNICWNFATLKKISGVFGEFPNGTGEEDGMTSGIIHVCLSVQHRGEEKKEYSCRFYLLLDVAAGSYRTSSRDILADLRLTVVSFRWTLLPTTAAWKQDWCTTLFRFHQSRYCVTLTFLFVCSLLHNCLSLYSYPSFFKWTSVLMFRPCRFIFALVSDVHRSRCGRRTQDKRDTWMRSTVSLLISL